MIMRCVMAILMLLLACVCLFSCEQAPQKEDPRHQHEYHVSDTVVGTCAAPGHQTFVCSCGGTFTSTVPTPHEYDVVTATDGTVTYTKQFCTVCGQFTVVRSQEYAYYVDFENVADAASAFEQGKTEMYRTSHSKHVKTVSAELVMDMGDMSLKSSDTNIYTIDKTRSVEAGADFVISMDVRFESHGHASVFSIICQNKGASDFSYNGGLVFIEADGKLSTVSDGVASYYKEVYFSGEEYDNVTVKGNIKTGLYDVFFNGELVRKDVSYVRTDFPEVACLRFFDAQNSSPYVAFADNLKLYFASEPEFLTDENEAIYGTDANGDFHIHVATEQIVEPTCLKEGSLLKICSICNEQLSGTPIEKSGHVAATTTSCTEDSSCKFCGAFMASAAGHKVTTYTETKAATNTTEGYKKGKCSICGEEVVKIIPAGITDNFDNFPTGKLTSEVMTAKSAFGSGFIYKVKDGVFTVASEGNNRHIEKSDVNGNIYYYGAMNAETIEISMNLRLNNDPGSIKGLLSLLGDAEMRVVSVLKDKKLGFGLGDHPIPFVSYEVGKWFNLKVVLDTKTLNYEIYIDGEKVLMTETDSANKDKHLVYVLDDGEMVLLIDGEDYDGAALHDVNERCPFVMKGNALTGIELFHYTGGLSCTMDDFTIRFVNK